MRPDWSEIRIMLVMTLAVCLAAWLYSRWWHDQPENRPVPGSYYKSGKAPDVPRKWWP